MNQISKHKTQNYKTLRRKHRGKALSHRIWQSFPDFEIKGTGNKRKNR